MLDLRDSDVNATAQREKRDLWPHLCGKKREVQLNLYCEKREVQLNLYCKKRDLWPHPGRTLASPLF